MEKWVLCQQVCNLVISFKLKEGIIRCPAVSRAQGDTYHDVVRKVYYRMIHTTWYHVCSPPPTPRPEPTRNHVGHLYLHMGVHKIIFVKCRRTHTKMATVVTPGRDAGNLHSDRSLVMLQFLRKLYSFVTCTIENYYF